MELIRARLGDVIDLGCSVPPLIDRVRKGVDGYLRNGVQTQNQVSREAAVQIGQGVVRFESVNDVAVRERRESVELHVAVSVRAPHEIIAAACRVDEGARGKL